jgi:hypothetical protein
MTKANHALFVFLLSGVMVVCAAPQEGVPPDLKAVALRDAACSNSNTGDASDSAASLTALPIRTGGRELGMIVEVQGACHCQSNNCDTLVYVGAGQTQRLAFHEKYASLHPMKVVKRGMPSLTGTYEVSTVKVETTVYDWDGKDYRPSLCATVIKNRKIPTIAQHACKRTTERR